MKKFLVHIYIRACRLIWGVKKNKVVFSSFNGKSYSDNPRAVSEKLHIMMQDAEIVWLINKTKSKTCLPSYIRVVDAGSAFASYKELATAAVWVNNFSLQQIPKGKEQLFIQTWHGDKAFKKVLHDSSFAETGVEYAEEIPGYCDLAVAGSEYGKRQYESAFRYQGKVLMEGTPRNDRLINPDPALRTELKVALKIDPPTKVLLYAPTLRRKQAASKREQPIRNLDIVATLDALQKKDGCKWVCLLRAHPAMVGLCGVREDDWIMDVSFYEDMADLLMIADMLITDYSSCAGDFALTRRPVVLFQADRKEYLEKDRTFYFDMEDSPYFIAENQQQLEQIIGQLTPEAAAENCEAILRFYGDCETGHAAESVANIIKNWIEK